MAVNLETRLEHGQVTNSKSYRQELVDLEQGEQGLAGIPVGFVLVSHNVNGQVWNLEVAQKNDGMRIAVSRTHEGEKTIGLLGEILKNHDSEKFFGEGGVFEEIKSPEELRRLIEQGVGEFWEKVAVLV